MGKGVSAFVLTLKCSMCLFIMSCTTALAGLSPPPNQIGNCFLLQHWVRHQFVITRLYRVRFLSSSCFVTDQALWAPRSPDTSSPILPASAPGQLGHSAALQLCQAEEGTPVCMTCQKPCRGPSVCSAAEFQFHPRCCPLPVLSCGCQHLQPVTHCCCGSPCSSSGVAGSW